MLLLPLEKKFNRVSTLLQNNVISSSLMSLVFEEVFGWFYIIVWILCKTFVWPNKILVSDFM